MRHVSVSERGRRGDESKADVVIVRFLGRRSDT